MLFDYIRSSPINPVSTSKRLLAGWADGRVGHSHFGRKSLPDHFARLFVVSVTYHSISERLGLPSVLEYSRTTRVENYSSNFLLLEYSVIFHFRLQISVSGCSFFRSHLMNCWNLWKLGARDLSATCQSENVSEYIHVEGGCLFKALTYRAPCRCAYQPPLALAACIKVLPVLKSTRVENRSLAAALGTLILQSISPPFLLKYCSQRVKLNRQQ